MQKHYLSTNRAFSPNKTLRMTACIYDLNQVFLRKESCEVKFILLTANEISHESFHTLRSIQSSFQFSHNFWTQRKHPHYANAGFSLESWCWKIFLTEKYPNSNMIRRLIYTSIHKILRIQLNGIDDIEVWQRFLLSILCHFRQVYTSIADLSDSFYNIK